MAQHAATCPHCGTALDPPDATVCINCGFYLRPRPGRASVWEVDELEYGYVLERSAGLWWHLHFGPSPWTYYCELLRCRTDVLGCIQRFAAGGVARSSRYVLTLDGEGVEIPEAKLDFRWRDRAVAIQFQREVMPLLHESSDFQFAAWEVVDSQRHRRLAPMEKLVKADRSTDVE